MAGLTTRRRGGREPVGPSGAYGDRESNAKGPAPTPSPGRTQALLLPFAEAQPPKAATERLEAARAVLARRDDLDVSATVPACYSGAGFSEKLQAAADAGRVVLVDLDRLYRGQ